MINVGNFSEFSGVKSHQMNHTREKSYKCDGVGKISPRSKTMKRIRKLTGMKLTNVMRMEKLSATHQTLHCIRELTHVNGPASVRDLGVLLGRSQFQEHQRTCGRNSIKVMNVG